MKTKENTYLVLNEVDSRKFLDNYGVRFNKYGFAANQQEAIQLASNMKFPLVMKVVSPKIIHKSDFGGVHLNLHSMEDVEKAYKEIIKSVAEKGVPCEDVHGVILQEMVHGVEEVLVGLKKDSIFGPVLVIGLGGTLVELMRDVALGICPLSKENIEAMLSKLRGLPLLQGYRGRPKGDVEALVRFVETVSNIALQCNEILEMDLNPVIVGPEGSGVWAVDARVVLSGKEDK